MRFEDLRAKHPELIYEGFDIDYQGNDLKVTFNFLLSPDIKFNPTIIFPNIFQERLDLIGKETLENMIFNLGMVELLSYWKAACPPKIIIKAGFLSQDQIAWWRNLLIKGLGEFFYTNQINFQIPDLVDFEIKAQDIVSPVFDKSLLDRNLILVGGGKDSAVTLDILGGSKEFNCLMLNPTPASLEIAKTGGCDNPIIIKRTIDPKLLELNSLGYLNGHTPFSAYLAFLGSICGIFYDFKYVIVSNEASSNEGNINYQGIEINHQYSKSYEFEKNFDEYLKKYIFLEISYFSFLRPLIELQIAKLFAPLEKYHLIFRSCNKGSKTNSWCKSCSKCLFAYLILYPFLGKKTEEIFGENLLEKESLVPTALDLIRVNEKAKPFDCVGMASESKLAALLGIKKAEKENEKIPLILEKMKPNLEESDILNSWNDEHNLPEEYLKLLKNRYQQVVALQ